MLGDSVEFDSEVERESEVIRFRVEAPTLYLGVAMTYRDAVVVPRTCLQRIGAPDPTVEVAHCVRP